MVKLRDGRGWVTKNGERIAPLDVAASHKKRTRGLLGRNGVEGAILLSPCSGVHTFQMRFDIDVAYLDRSWTVIDMVRMRRNRLGRNRLRARHVLEAEWGALERWGVTRGDRLEVEYDESG